MSGPVWEVVGGADKGGILVRTGKELKSPEASSRLSTGARVKEINLHGERLEYTLISGTGPWTGWVSLKLKDKVLMVKADDAPEAVKADDAPKAVKADDASGAEPKPDVPSSEVAASKPGLSGTGEELLDKYKTGQLDALIEEYHKILCAMPYGPPLTGQEPRKAGAPSPWGKPGYVPVEPAEGRPRVLFQGDSIVHGSPMTNSASFVGAVAQRNSSIRFENSGWGGAMSMTLAEPADFGVPIPKAGDYEADYVFIMIGTNDAMAMASSDEWTDTSYVPTVPGAAPARIPKDWREKCRPSPELYESSLKTIVHRYREKGIPVGLATIPPLGEDLTDKVDKDCRRSPFVVVSELAAATKRIAADEGATLLPFFECACHRFSKLDRAPIMWTPKAFGVRMGAGIAQRQSEQTKKSTPKLFKDFGHPNGRPDFAFDLVHLNEDGAAILAALIQEWLDAEVRS